MARVKFEVCWRQACSHQRLLRGKNEEEEPSPGHPPDPRLESDSLGPVSEFKIGKHFTECGVSIFSNSGKEGSTSHYIVFRRMNDFY